MIEELHESKVRQREQRVINKTRTGKYLVCFECVLKGQGGFKPAQSALSLQCCSYFL